MMKSIDAFIYSMITHPYNKERVSVRLLFTSGTFNPSNLKTVHKSMFDR